MFTKRKDKLQISERDPQYKVKYLGNVLTAFMKGEGCVDRPASVLWDNYVAHPTAGLDMELTVCATGLKVVTKEQGLTDYRAHRISYCVCHPQFPKLFIWVYRHEGKRMKVEVRCHAVLCNTEAKAKAIAVHLHEKLAFALGEFTREKTRRQNSRIVLSRAYSLPSTTTPAGIPIRTKFLCVGQNFKPPSDRSNSAPKLGAISEEKTDSSLLSIGNGHSKNGRPKNGFTVDSIAEDEEEEEVIKVTIDTRGGAACIREERSNSVSGSVTSGASNDDVSDEYDIEIGNNIDELKLDENVRKEIALATADHATVQNGFPLY